MRTRILPTEEWGRLGEAEIPALLKYMEPQNVKVVVVEADDEVIGCVAVLQVTHFEGPWIKPEWRGNAGVFRALIRAAYEVPRSRLERWIFGGAATGDDHMESLCRRLGGQQLPVELFVLPVGE